MSNAAAMTDVTDQDTPPGPNLAILKGIVWGMGFLLILGFGLVAVMLARGPRSEALAPSIDIPLAAGETILSTGIEEGRLVALLGRGGLPHRIMIIDMRTNEVSEIPVSVTAPITEQ